MGRGGKAFFALDVTNPADTAKSNTLIQANASGIFKWMFTSADDADLGYVLGDHAVSYTHLRAHETVLDLVCRLLLEKKTHIHPALYTI